MIVAGATAYPRVIDPVPVPGDRRRGRCAASCSTPPTSPASSPAASTRTRCPAPTWSPSPPTRRCGAHAGAASSASEEHGQAIDKAVFPGLQGGPLEHVIAAKAVAFREAVDPVLRVYAAPDRGQRRGLGRGPGQQRASGSCRAGPTTTSCWSTCGPSTTSSPARRPRPSSTGPASRLNRNTIPDDPRSPFVTSGVRIGTAAVTTQGMREPEMAEIGDAHRQDPAGSRRRGRAGCGPRRRARPSAPSSPPTATAEGSGGERVAPLH